MPKPVVASYCTTFLKPEMLHIYRQVTGLQRYETFVLANERLCADRYPFDAIEMLPGRNRNILRRLHLKYIRRLPALHYRGEIKPLRAILARRPADLMHIYFGHTGVYLLPFIKEWKAPTIVSFHGADVQSRAHDPKYEEQLRELLQVVPLVLARSQSLIARLCELGCPPEKIRLNRTGIPLDEFPYQPRVAPANGEWRFIQACRFVPKKGILTTLKAFAIFLESHPRARLHLAGDGPMRAEIEAHIANHRLGGSVEICGFLSQKALADLFRASHFFLHPSETTANQDQEGVPNSMLEAMSTGLPVLATQHGGIPEAVANGESGILVPERDHDALAKAMLDLAAAPERLFAMGEAAAKSVAEHFSQRAAITKLESYYDEVRALKTR